MSTGPKAVSLWPCASNVVPSGTSVEVGEAAPRRKWFYAGPGFENQNQDKCVARCARVNWALELERALGRVTGRSEAAPRALGRVTGRSEAAPRGSRALGRVGRSEAAPDWALGRVRVRASHVNFAAGKIKKAVYVYGIAEGNAWAQGQRP